MIKKLGLNLGLSLGCYGDRTFVVRTDSRDAIKRLDRNTAGKTAQIKLTSAKNIKGNALERFTSGFLIAGGTDTYEIQQTGPDLD